MSPSPADSQGLKFLLMDVSTDPNVAGVLLTGSQARAGTATASSDVDVYVVLDAPDPLRPAARSTRLGYRRVHAQPTAHGSRSGG